MLRKAVVAFVLSVLSGAGFAAIAAAQDKPLDGGPAQPQETAKPPARPAVTVLFDKLQPATAAKLRLRLKELLGANLANKDPQKPPKKADSSSDWLAKNSSGLVGALAGDRFQVLFENARLDLTEKECGHLDSGEIAAMKRHTAHAVIELQGAFDASTLVDNYKVLGAIAAGLLRRGTLGISAREFGTFESVDADLLQSLLENPVLDVLRPVAESTLVVLLSKPRKLTEASLEKAMAKEFPKLFGKDGAGFVVVQEGVTIVSLAGAIVMLTLNAKAEMAPDSVEELRVQKAIADHQAILHLWTSGALDSKAERLRQKNLARVAAALWQDDCLALSWYCDLAMVPSHTKLVAQLRSDDPVKKTLGEGVVPVLQAVDENAMEKAITMARKTWPDALKKSQAGVNVSAKFPFPTRSGGIEHIWVSVQKVDGDQMHGAIGNEPVDIEGLKLGSKVTRKLGELSDWIYFENGEMVGGYTVKVLQRRAAASKKR